MRIVGGPTADAVDDWDDPGPRHPSEDARFIVRYDAYPGGPDAYWREYRTGLADFEQHMIEYLDRPPAAEGADALRAKVDKSAYYALKRRVFDVSEVVRLLAGVTSRNLAHWLVKDRGFPWRNDCSVDDLNRLLSFLQDPATVDLARLAPDYPAHVQPDQDDDRRLEPAAVHEVLVRFAAKQLSLDQAVELLDATYAAAVEDRDERDTGRSLDALDVLDAAQSAPLGERRHRALVEALDAGAAE